MDKDVTLGHLLRKAGRILTNVSEYKISLRWQRFNAVAPECLVIPAGKEIPRGHEFS